MNLWTCNDFITLCLLFFRQLALSMESEASNPVAVAPPLDLHTTPVRVARKKQAVKKITPRKAKKNKYHTALVVMYFDWFCMACMALLCFGWHLTF